MSYRISKKNSINFVLNNWEQFETDFDLLFPVFELFAIVSDICEDIVDIDFQGKWVVPFIKNVKDGERSIDFNFEIEYFEGVKASTVLVKYIGNIKK